MLEVKNLSISFITRMGANKAVDNVSFTVESGKITAIIGESGSGKSVACCSLLGLVTSRGASRAAARQPSTQSRAR